MKLILSLLLISSITYQKNIFPRMSYRSTEMPKHKINLNLPVKERYREILQSKSDGIRAYAFVTSLSPIAYLLSKSSSYFLLNKINQDPEWYEYIEAVSEYTGITLSEAIMLSATYDIACTSIIIQNKNEILLGRNLDFGTYFITAHLVFEADYYLDNILLYKGIEMAGFRGGINATKPGKFSVSLNLRRDNSNVFGNLWRIYNGMPTPNYNIMLVMRKAENFQQAFDMLSRNKTSAPVFYTITGVDVNEGVVISKGVDNVYREDWLDDRKGINYLVVCNTDFDKKEPMDNYRREPTKENINRIGIENINGDNLLNDVLGVYPTNNIITIYSAVHSLKDERNIKSIIWLP